MGDGCSQLSWREQGAHAPVHTWLTWGGGNCTAGQSLAQSPLVERTLSSSMTSIFSNYMFSCEELPRGRERLSGQRIQRILSPSLPQSSLYCVLCLCPIGNSEPQGEQIHGSHLRADTLFLQVQLSLNLHGPLFMGKTLSS